MGEEERSRQADADQREVLDAAMEAGHILLENGAEIFRVEETIDRICHSFGVESEDAFVLSNGIFLTAGNEREKRFARVKHIPVKGAQLDKVAAVNQLSREIEAGRHSLLQVKEELARIRRMPGKPAWMQVLFSGQSPSATAHLTSWIMSQCRSSSFASSACSRPSARSRRYNSASSRSARPSTDIPMPSRSARASRTKSSICNPS